MDNEYLPVLSQASVGSGERKKKLMGGHTHYFP
jgi:hypothetical protein